MARFNFTHASFELEHDDVHAQIHSITAELAPADRSTGPGWYESSWDLRRGLVVHEGLPRDVRLHEWLEHQLRAQPA